MRRTVLAISMVAVLGGAAAADTFGGFSGVDRFYLVAPDRVCAPLAVVAAKATGMPKCEKAAADRIAQLSIKPAPAERGARARVTASATGRVVTIKAGDRDVVLVEWSSLDPITRVEAVYGSTYADLVAVAVVVRRAGREVVDVIGFDLGRGSGSGPGSGSGSGVAAGSGSGTGSTDIAVDKAVVAALTRARATRGAKAIAAWTKVLALDPESSEALYGLAVAQLKAKRPAEAFAALAALATSRRADAIEYRVAARFDKAFAAVRGDAKFRAAVGLDQPQATMYERVMGLGGGWEQAPTCGVSARVQLVLTRDKKFKLGVSSRCHGDAYAYSFKGAWSVDDRGLVLVFPNRGGRADDATRCEVQTSGDEDSIDCAVDDDLRFSLLPVRR